ncbi:MAG: hypothetical protein WBA81_20505 [Rhodococcus sp. (in: high G+C Gram-positive bacteria)]
MKNSTGLGDYVRAAQSGRQSWSPQSADVDDNETEGDPNETEAAT